MGGAEGPPGGEGGEEQERKRRFSTATANSNVIFTGRFERKRPANRRHRLGGRVGRRLRRGIVIGDRPVPVIAPAPAPKPSLAAHHWFRERGAGAGKAPAPFRSLVEQGLEDGAALVGRDPSGLGLGLQLAVRRLGGAHGGGDANGDAN